ncbi:hypothetical protein [Nonomuraea sp. NPDC049141]|uniref:hypothetical protein n=1 Tax=Nonomuraea sp. NPDC049141 TaxID=3155500 RepID=UPI0033FC50A7
MIRPLLAGACLVSALLGCTAAPAVAGQRYHATELRPGDCIEPMPENAMVTVVPCSVPHAAEFATTYVIPNGPWPGSGEVVGLAAMGCGPKMRYVESRIGEAGATVIVPTEADWPRYRTAYCLAVPFDGGKLVGRVIK